MFINYIISMSTVNRVRVYLFIYFFRHFFMGISPLTIHAYLFIVFFFFYFSYNSPRSILENPLKALCNPLEINHYFVDVFILNGQPYYNTLNNYYTISNNISSKIHGRKRVVNCIQPKYLFLCLHTIQPLQNWQHLPVSFVLLTLCTKPTLYIH